MLVYVDPFGWGLIRVQARGRMVVQGRAAIQEPTAHPAVGQADSVTCRHVIA